VGGDKDTNFLGRLIAASPSPRMINHSWKRRGQVTWINHLNFGGHQPQLWNGWSWSDIFCTQVGYIKGWSGSRDAFCGPQWYLWIGGSDSRQILQTDKLYIISQLKMTNYTPKEVWPVSRNHFSITTPAIISPERLILKRQSPNFVCR